MLVLCKKSLPVVANGLLISSSAYAPDLLSIDLSWYRGAGHKSVTDLMRFVKDLAMAVIRYITAVQITQLVSGFAYIPVVPCRTSVTRITMNHTPEGDITRCLPRGSEAPLGCIAKLQVSSDRRLLGPNPRCV